MQNKKVLISLALLKKDIESQLDRIESDDPFDYTNCWDENDTDNWNAMLKGVETIEKYLTEQK